MEIKEVPISELKFAEYNPRIITRDEFSGLKNSLKTFGFVDPAIINADNTIVGGHQRVRAWKELGHDTAPCIVVNIDKRKEKKLNIILNSPAISASS